MFLKEKKKNIILKFLTIFVENSVEIVKCSRYCLIFFHNFKKKIVENFKMIKIKKIF